MRRRRPPFALVIVALVAVFAGLFVLISGGGGRSTGTVHIPDATSAKACVTARAEAPARARETLVAPVQASVPVAVTGTSGGVSIKLSETVVERATATRTIEVQRDAVVARRTCARASTTDAAHGSALARAYKKALAIARERARAAAAKAASTLATQQLPALRATADQEVQARARAAAAIIRKALTSRALAEARKQARRIG